MVWVECWVTDRWVTLLILFERLTSSLLSLIKVQKRGTNNYATFLLGVIVLIMLWRFQNQGTIPPHLKAEMLDSAKVGASLEVEVSIGVSVLSLRVVENDVEYFVCLTNFVNIYALPSCFIGLKSISYNHHYILANNLYRTIQTTFQWESCCYLWMKCLIWRTKTNGSDAESSLYFVKSSKQLWVIVLIGTVWTTLSNTLSGTVFALLFATLNKYLRSWIANKSDVITHIFLRFRKIVDQVEYLTSAEQVAEYIKTFR